MTVDLKFTRHGPILWEDSERALALRWVGAEPGTAGTWVRSPLTGRRTGRNSRRRCGRWKVPSENIVYADRAGNIGEHSTGLDPMRKWTGLLPVPGNGNYEWSGFVPNAELPHHFNPRSGIRGNRQQQNDSRRVSLQCRLRVVLGLSNQAHQGSARPSQGTFSDRRKIWRTCRTM